MNDMAVLPDFNIRVGNLQIQGPCMGIFHNPSKKQSNKGENLTNLCLEHDLIIIKFSSID